MARLFLMTAAFLSFCAISGAAQARSAIFSTPWQLTEEEPASWAANPTEIDPEKLDGWRAYNEPAVPPLGINKTIWLKQIVPPLDAGNYGLFFKNGLEDLSIYVDGVLIYSYGSFTRKWTDGSGQRWHFIPLRQDQAGRTLHIRTHYMIGYMTRTLYPVIEREGDVYARQISQSLPLTLAAGAFGVLAVLCLTIAAQRRMMDVFFHFGIMTLCALSWIMFNQDSMMKQFTLAPIWAWSYLDVLALLVAVPTLFAFLNSVLNKSSRLVHRINIVLTLLAGSALILPLFGLLHPWYLLPIMHMISIPPLFVIIPRVVFDSFRQNPEARDLSFGAVMVSISGIHDAVRYSGYLNSPFRQMIPLGISCMFAAMLMVLIRRYRREMESHLHRVEAMVEEKTREIRSIFSQIQQGIFMVEGQDLVLNREYSAHLENLLEEKNMGGKSFRQCFLDKTEIGADQRHGLLSILLLSLGEDEASFDLNTANLPHETRLHGRILELTWAPIIDAQHRTEKILVTARDVTSLRELQNAAQRNQEEMQLIQVILTKKPERFARFLKASGRLLIQIWQTLDNAAIAQAEDMKTLFRNLHTLKGNSRSFGLDSLADLVHKAEQELLNLNWVALRSSAQAMGSLLDQCESILQNRLGWNQDSDQIMLDRGLFEQFILRNGTREALDRLLLPQVFVPAQQLFLEIFNSVHRIAEDLGKAKPMLQLKAEGFYFPKNTEEMLTHCFGHIFRNAVDHGLEPAETRLLKGKAKAGSIQVRLSLHQQMLMIHCQDDGRGIDLKQIREKARARGLLAQDEELNEKRVEEVLFASGFSTKAQATLVSGRGIGLDAVRAFLRDLGGNIHLIVRKKDSENQTWQIAFELQLPPGTFHQSMEASVEYKAS